MTLLQLADAIRQRKGPWSVKKRIVAELLNHYPRLRDARVAVLIDNGDSHIVFQEHNLGAVARGRFVIPHAHKLWTGFLARGRIVHIASNPERSELIRRWFTPVELEGVTQLAFIPVWRKQDGWFVTCIASAADPALPPKR